MACRQSQRGIGHRARETPNVVNSGIAINASIIGDRPTGVGGYTLGLVKALIEARPGLVVHTSSVASLPPGRSMVRPTSSLIRPERGMAGHAARLLWCQTALRVRLRRDRADVLLNTMPEGVLHCQVPQVTIVHDLIPLMFPHDYPRQQLYFRQFVPRVLRESRIVIADSEATRRQVIMAYGLMPERLRVIPGGYDAERFRVGPEGREPKEPYVLYVGNVLPHKNLTRLVEAFAEVRRRVPTRLVLAGRGRRQHIAAVTSLVARLRVPVELRSYVPSDELPDLYRGAQVVVLPSLAEGFGLTALEAMASGTPVVAANVSAIPEVVGDAGLLVDPYDTRAIADAIVLLLTEEERRKDLIARGLKRVEQFSWQRTAGEVLALLDSVRRL
jgi:glycosyltransferase involved in cell wall biosynthesis